MNRIRQDLRGLAFISPWLIGFVVFTAIPVVVSFYCSLCDYTLLQPPLFKGLDNYRALGADPLFWKVLRNTANYAVVALPLGMVVAIAIAMLLNSKIRGVSIYRTIVFLPSLVPAVAGGMLWLWLFNAKLGLINAFLRIIGIDNPPAWLSEAPWAMNALIIMSVWGVGNSVVIYLAGLQDVPRELYEAADIDGASAIDKIFHVTLPGISPVIFFNLIMGIIGTLQSYATPAIVTGQGPNRTTYLYTMYLYDNAFMFVKMGYASAMGWVMLVIVLVLTGLAAWSSKHWVHYQGK